MPVGLIRADARLSRVRLPGSLADPTRDLARFSTEPV